MARRLPLAFLSSVIMVATLVLVGASPAGAVVSGINGRIVIASDRGGSLQVWAVRPDGTAGIQLTSSTSGTNYDPAFSADGTRIAFISTRNGSPQLFQMTATGGSQTLVATTGVTPSHPTWAPNGTAIGFAGLKGTDSDIYTVKPTGTGMVDLTPDLTNFDANPQWSPGGITIAFDRTDATGATNIWSIQQTGINLKQLTTSGHDSHPSWSPDNKTIAFQSSRDSVTGPVPFVTGVNAPVGMAFTSGGLLITQQRRDKVSTVSPAGVVTTYATLPSTGNADIERYIAVSPGLGCFTAGEVYVSVQQTIYQIDPITKAVTTFATIPDLPNSNNFLTFDQQGTFGFGLLVIAGQRSKVYGIDCNGNWSQLADLSGTTPEIEGSEVAPLTWAPFGGDLMAASKFDNTVYAISPGPGPNNAFSVVGTWPAPEQVLFVPHGICNWSTSGGAYFVNIEGSNEILKFSANSFPGLAGTPSALVTSEDATGIGQFTSNGVSIDISQFYGPPSPPLGTPDLEEEQFVSGCPTSFARPAAPTTSLLTSEIYTMSSLGANQTRLTTNSFDDARPAWSPDGTTILFASDRDDPNQPTCEATLTCLYEIYSMTTTGGSQTNISNDLSFNDTSPDWETVSFTPIVVDDFSFTPNIAKPKLGGTVLWEIHSTHTVTDNSSPNMGLFDSGTMNAGGFFVFNFVAAGQYPVFCTIHTFMTMTVKVPMKAVPTTGTQTTTFTITWASGTPPAGYKFDVQIKRPSDTTFSDWLPLTALKSTTFTPDGGTGVYSFQARLHNTVNGGTSNYSVPVSITVNP